MSDPEALGDATDERAAPYRHLIRVGAPGAGDRLDGVFVAEGTRTLRLLFDRGWPVESLLLSDRRLPAVPDLVASAERCGAAVYTASQEVLDGIAGYNVHRGVLAIVRRPRLNPVDDVVAGAGPLLLGIEAVNDLENLGSLFRNAAAFGVGGVVLDPSAADPLYRRSVRVSIGHVLDVPYARSTDWPADLVAACRAGGRRLVALTPGGSVPLDSLPPSDGPWAVLVGAEGEGLSPTALEAADLQVRIPMAGGVDSVNVATAAAIAMHHLART